VGFPGGGGGGISLYPPPPSQQVQVQQPVDINATRRPLYFSYFSSGIAPGWLECGGWTSYNSNNKIRLDDYPLKRLFFLRRNLTYHFACIDLFSLFTNTECLLGLLKAYSANIIINIILIIIIIIHL